jgi:tetratricopeptide (TPR) repeat protein
MAYFQHARIVARTEEALAWLRARQDRLGDRSGAPTETLFWALDQLGRGPEAFTVLDRAFERRSDDAELRAFAARELAEHGEFERAERELEAARDRLKHVAWLRASGAVAERRGDQGRALACWREVCALEPLSVEAHRQVAALTSRRDGREAAACGLARAGEGVPEHRGLLILRIEFLRGTDEPAAEQLLRDLIERQPHDAWAHRELALCLLDQDRGGDALEAAWRALELDPRTAASHAILASALEAEGAVDGACAHYREAIALDVDYGMAIVRLVGACPTTEDKVSSLDYVASELERQVVFGEGLSAYRRAAGAVLAPEKVLDLLQQAIDARPELWTAWSELIRQLAAMGRVHDAAHHVRTATQRFPLVADLWMDRAEVAAALGEEQERLESLERLCRIAPHWDWAARELGVALQQAGQLGRGRAILEATIRRSPRDPHARGCLADILWEQDEPDGAIAQLEAALRLDPSYAWAWRTHARFVGDDSDRTRELARKIAVEQPGQPAAWLALADVIEETDLQEALDALDRVLALEPRSSESIDRRMRMLAAAGHFDEALAESERVSLGEAARASVDARTAWVLAQRGDLPEAIEAMRAVLERAPSLYGAWKQLEDWCEHTGDAAGAVEAAQSMTALAPSDPESWGYLGAACLMAEDAPSAREALRRAFNLAPSYQWAGLQLFDLELGAGELEAAEATLERLEAEDDGDSEYVRCSRVELEARRGRRDRSLSAFAQLCQLDSSDARPIEAAITALSSAGFDRELERQLDRHLEADSPVARVADAWAACMVESRREREARRRIDALVGRAPAPRVALRALITALGARPSSRRLRHCRRLLRKHRALFRTDTDLWGIYGYALVNALHYWDATRWLGDWREREEVEAWMLQNLALSFRELGRWKKAASVSRHAVEIATAADAAHHRLWLGWEALRLDRGTEADAWIEPIDSEWLGETEQVLLRGVVSIRAIERATRDEREATFREVRLALDATAQAALARRYSRKTFRRLAMRIGRRVGPAAWGWALRRRLLG